MILYLCVRLSLCLCLAHGFVNSNSKFDFFEFSTLKRYLSFCWFSLLAAAGRAVRHVYVWLWADFLDFSLQFFFRKIFFELLCGSTTLKNLV